MSTSDQQNSERTAVQEADSIDTQLDRIESELEDLRDYVERVDRNTVNESTLNLLIGALAADGVNVDFQADPGQNRDALETVTERLADLETTVELLQHQNAEVGE